MANCHFDQIKKPVPVGVITDLDNKIIVANVPENQYDVTNYNKSHGEWLMSGARAMITRFWACSTSTIVIVPHMPSIFNSCPPLPPELSIEKEFCLWLGYIEQIRRVDNKDLEEGNLLKVFVGVIDNIKSTASAKGGYTIQIQARDRMKWFMDSEVYYSVHEVTKVFKDTIDASGGQGVPRSRVIHDIARRSIGAPPVSVDPTLVEAYEAKRDITLDEKSEDIGVSTTTEINPYKFYKNGDLQSKTKTYDKVSLNPKLKVITTRISLGGRLEQEKTKNEGLSFLLNGQIPLDIIKSIAFQEVYPTEFFQDNRDGNFYYVPRTNDSSGLQDKDKFYRTYFFKVENKQDLFFQKIESDYIYFDPNKIIPELNITQKELENKELDIIYPDQKNKDKEYNIPEGYELKKITVKEKRGSRTFTYKKDFFIKIGTNLTKAELEKKANEIYNEKIEAGISIDIDQENSTAPADPSGVVNTIENKKTNLTVSPYPTDLYESTNQDLIAYREELSSIGMKTNFFISISSPLTSMTPHNDMVLHLATNPYSLRDVDFVPKFHRINDPTIKTAEEAAVVALSAARIWAKETNVAMAVMLGDPSLVPGEVIQVVGSPILPEGGRKQIQEDREKYFEWEINTDKMVKSYAKFSSSIARKAAVLEKIDDKTNIESEDTEFIVKKTGVKGEFIGKLYDNSQVDIRVGNKKYKGGLFNLFDTNEIGGEDELTGDVEFSWSISIEIPASIFSLYISLAFYI